MLLTRASVRCSGIITMLLLFLGGCTSDNTRLASKEKSSQKVIIPLGGNAFQTGPENGDQITTDGITNWSKSSSRYSIFIKFSHPATADVLLRGSAPAGRSVVEFRHGKTTHNITIDNATTTEVKVGSVEISQQGYARFDLRGLQKTGHHYARISDLILEIPPSVDVTYVRNNKQNRFYWGRRGPSVHLNYRLPEQTDIQWFYNEITVPPGQDPVGSYFMANGFGEGYFGIQVNSENERRVLFSVWSPYETDNPEDIPRDQRIQVLKKGEGVYTGKFGNEGSGGQSYWVYPWTAGTTYRFLNSVHPDGNGNTIYTAYFYLPVRRQWKLIAQFKRPKTDTWYAHPHSFLENFAVKNGFKGRRAWYHNQWARDKNGRWYELTRARFTGDDIAQRGYREDFAGGVKDGRFFLRNGGFFDDNIPLNSIFSRKNEGEPPSINFNNLP